MWHWLQGWVKLKLAVQLNVNCISLPFSPGAGNNWIQTIKPKINISKLYQLCYAAGLEPNMAFLCTNFTWNGILKLFCKFYCFLLVFDPLKFFVLCCHVRWSARTIPLIVSFILLLKVGSENGHYLKSSSPVFTLHLHAWKNMSTSFKPWKTQVKCCSSTVTIVTLFLFLLKHFSLWTHLRVFSPWSSLFISAASKNIWIDWYFYFYSQKRVKKECYNHTNACNFRFLSNLQHKITINIWNPFIWIKGNQGPML